MEGCVAVEKNNQTGDLNLAPNSLESSIKIDSISIDLNANERTEAEKCSHFSIRAYVAEVRKKDWKRCWPFASDGDSNKTEERADLLPSLQTPKFRYWRCQNCLRELGSKGTVNNCGPLQPLGTVFKSNGICSHALVLGHNTAAALSDIQQAQKSDNLEGREAGVNGPSNLSDTTEHQSSPRIRRREKKNAAANSSIIAKKKEADDKINHDTQRISRVPPEAISSLKPYNTVDTVNLKSKCNRATDLYKSESGHQEPAEVEFAGNIGCTIKCKFDGTGKENSMDDKDTDLIASAVCAEAANINTPYAEKDHGDGHPSPELDECDNASSESAEIIPGSNSGSLYRRKTRKVRLLTELLCEKGDAENDNIRSGDSLSNAVADESAGADRFPSPQGEGAVQGNVKRSLTQNRKRKLAPDEDGIHLDVSSLDKACKDVKIPRGDVESTDALGSEHEGDEFAGIGSETGIKNHWTKCRIDASPVIGKKRNKKALTFDECLSLEPSTEKVADELEDKNGYTSKRNAADRDLFKPVQNTLSNSEIDLFPVPADKMERQHSFSKNKDTMLQVDDQNTYVISLSHDQIRGGPMALNDTENIPTAPTSVIVHSAEDTPSEKGLSLSLNSFMATQKCDRSYSQHILDGQTSLLNWQEGTSKEDQPLTKAAEVKFSQNFSFTAKPTEDVFSTKAIHKDMSGKIPIHRMPILDEKQKCTSQSEFGACSLMQPKDICQTSSSGKTNLFKNFCSSSSKHKASGTMEHSSVTGKDRDIRADKASEQGALDDIPMEIVELLAKNQYERYLADAECDKHQIGKTNSARSGQKMDFNKGYGPKELSFFNPETTRKQKPRAKNCRNGIVIRDEIVKPIKESAVDYVSQIGQSRFNMSQLEQICTPGGFGTFLRHREEPSSGVHYSASSSSRKSAAQNCQWTGNVAGIRSSQTNLDASGLHNSCQNVPHQTKANHLWTPMVPNHMPFVYSISQKCMTASANLDVLSHSPVSTHKETMHGSFDLKLLNRNPANLGTRTRNLSSESLSRIRAEYPFTCKHSGINLNQKPVGSTDPYTNDTISAMHLLSLMDPGLQSKASCNMDPTTKLLKIPSGSQDQHSRELPRIGSGADKAPSNNRSKHPPYECHSKSQSAEINYQHIYPMPVAGGASSSSFQPDKFFKKAANFTSQISLERDKRKCSDSYEESRGRLQNSASTTGNVGTNCGFIPGHSMQTLLFSAPDNVLPSQFHAMQHPAKRKVDAPSSAGIAHPHKSNLKNELCTINRNPADFSVPEAGNEYMIAGEDLKCRKEMPFANGSGFLKLDGRKRQRKLPAAKEHGQPLIS